MTRSPKAIGVCLVAVFGLWGCARAPVPTPANNTSNDKIKALEARTAKLEDDLKAALAGKDLLRKKLTDSEDAFTQSQAQLQQTQTQLKEETERTLAAVKEREELKIHLKTRTTERDLVQGRYEGFLQDLKELAGRAETAMPKFKPANTGVASGDPVGPALPGGS
jgi:hypothetical protein